MRVRQYSGYTNYSSLVSSVDSSSLTAIYRKNDIEINSFQFSSKIEEVLKNSVYRHLLHYYSLIQRLPDTPVNVHHVLDISIAQIRKKLGQGKAILSIHDIIPILATEGRFGSSRQSFVQNLGAETFFLKQQLKRVNEYDKILVPSKSTAEDLQEMINLGQQKIEIVSPVLGDEFKKISRTVVRKFRVKHGLDPKSYWVVISGDDLRQNQRTSLQVLKELNVKSRRRILLLRLGAPNSYFEQMAKEYGVQELVHQIQVSDNSEKAIVFNLAHCFLYPSIYSGFGMPVVEAVACGAPVVISDRGALKELLPKHVTHINPFDIRALTKEVYRSITRKEVRELFASEAETLVEQYRATKVANRMASIYQSLIS